MRPDNSTGDRLAMAVGTIVFAVLVLSLGDAVIKGQAVDFGLWQVFVLRSLMALPVFAVLIAVFFRGQRLWPRAPWWAALRAGLLVVMWVAYYAALPHLQLSVAAAAYYTLPMFMTLFSALLTGDRVGRRGWGAVALGFVGVVIILKPSPEAINGYVLLPVFAAMLYALAMILTRTKCRGEHALLLGLHLNLAFVVAGALASGVLLLIAPGGEAGFLTRPWTGMSAAGWRVMALLALSIIVGSIGAAIAYKNAPPAIIGVFDLSYVGFAAIWGLLLFDEVPDALSLLGIITIVVAGGLALSARRGDG